LATIKTIRTQKNWSTYVTNLIATLQASIHQYSNIQKLRFLLYPSGLLPEHKAQIQQEGQGVVWLGKNEK